MDIKRFGQIIGFILIIMTIVLLLFMLIYSVNDEINNQNYCVNNFGQNFSYNRDGLEYGHFNCCEYKDVLENNTWINKKTCFAGKI